MEQYEVMGLSTEVFSTFFNLLMKMISSLGQKSEVPMNSHIRILLSSTVWGLSVYWSLQASKTCLLTTFLRFLFLCKISFY